MLTNQSIGYMDIPVPENIDLAKAIDKLRKEKNAVILAHYYQRLLQEFQGHHPTFPQAPQRGQWNCSVSYIANLDNQIHLFQEREYLPQMP